MSDFLAFVELGFRHITDPNGLDHVLFLLVLAAIYRPADWKPAVLVVTAFTVGHSITLALAVAGVLALPTELIEFLIPVTILAAAVENLAFVERQGPWRTRARPVFAAVFGLVHGAGFANYLRSLFMEELAVPLIGFNLGLEVGQVLVLALAFAAFAALDRVLGAIRLPPRAPAPVRLRVIAVSSLVALVACAWAVERSPW